MNIHKNARLTPLRREEMAREVFEGRLSKAQAARTYGVTSKVVKRWVERFEADGRVGMADRSSRPKVSPKRTAGPVADEIAAGPGLSGIPCAGRRLNIMPPWL